MLTLAEVIERYGEEYLILDGRKPTILNSRIIEELKLYNIEQKKYTHIFAQFYKYTQKTINTNSIIDHLSGGQKIILSLIIALTSDAQQLLLNGFFKALHPNRISEIEKYIKSKEFASKKILIFKDFLLKKEIDVI